MASSRNRRISFGRIITFVLLFIGSAAAVGLVLPFRLPLPPSGHETAVPRPPQAGAIPDVGSGATTPGKTEASPFVPGKGIQWRPEKGFEIAARLPDPLPTPPAAMEPRSLPERLARKVEVSKGDTLIDILLRAGIPRAEAHEALSRLKEVFDPRRLRPGQYLTLELERTRKQDRALRLASLSLSLDWARDVRLSRDARTGDFVVGEVARPLLRRTERIAGVVEDSLYRSARRHGLPRETLHALIRIFSWDVDFQRDLQPGDRFEVLFERLYTADGLRSRGGDVLFASLELAGRPVTAYRFRRADGTIAYFDRDGRSLRKSLLRTPIDGARLTSRFGMRRHPILGYTRMHRGVDFAAPRGTPVYAAGDGTIVFAGRKRGYGNFIRIRHNAQFGTGYAHLSRIARGIRRGKRVRQGQVIGYVGSTGLATGPHLHYEVYRNGRAINPLKLRTIASDRLRGRELERFRQVVAEVDALRRQLEEEPQLASYDLP